MILFVDPSSSVFLELSRYTGSVTSWFWFHLRSLKYLSTFTLEAFPPPGGPNKNKISAPDAKKHQSDTALFIFTFDASPTEKNNLFLKYMCYNKK